MNVNVGRAGILFNTESDDRSLEREQMDVDVLIVGGGAAGLSTALHLQNLIEKHNQDVEAGRTQGSSIPEQTIVVLEKGAEIGAHSFSGAVLDPSALSEMMPDFIAQGCPIESEVKTDGVYYLARDFHVKLPIVPRPFRNHGNYIISLSKFNRWLGEKVEAKGVNIFPGFAAVDALYDGDRIVGVRTGDKGREKLGKPKPNFEPGMLLKSKLTIFTEGVRGSLFQRVAKKLDLYKGKNPDVYEEGVKEIIQMPEGTVTPGQVIHTLGFPMFKSIGGTFIYTIPGDRIIIGLVGYLDTRDPLFNPHRELQRLKTHPFVAKMIKGGKVVAYGGKCLPAGGWYSMPKLYGDGFMVAGDTAAMVDVQRLKGIHLAMKSGMLVAETALAAIQKNDFSENTLSLYEQKIRTSFVKKELYRVRNFHQTLSKGILASLPMVALQEISGGRGLFDKMPCEQDAKTTESVIDTWGPDGIQNSENQLPPVDGEMFFDRLGSVFLTGTMHDEDSPNHLLVPNGDICRDICHPRFDSPCTNFCPAKVYEMVPDEEKQEKLGKRDKPQLRLQINYTNCIHCKTCDIKCPFENIHWTAPEGGGGPHYTET